MHLNLSKMKSMIPTLQEAHKMPHFFSSIGGQAQQGTTLKFLPIFDEDIYGVPEKTKGEDQ